MLMRAKPQNIPVTSRNWNLSKVTPPVRGRVEVLGLTSELGPLITKADNLFFFWISLWMTLTHKQMIFRLPLSLQTENSLGTRTYLSL